MGLVRVSRRKVNRDVMIGGMKTGRPMGEKNQNVREDVESLVERLEREE